jgi:two-component system probable response regulator PhcQ
MLNPDPTPRCGILYVDDEELALKYFRKAFTAKYPIFLARSAAEGLQILRQEAGRIGIVISDQRMPEMEGAEFLGLVRMEYPHIVRILTTAYSNLASAIEAVNTGHIYQYVVKPWEIEDLGMVLQRAWDYYRVLTERDELLALKLTALQRILCSDRLKWLLLWTRSLAEPEGSAARRALCAFVDALPDDANPLAAGRSAVGPRQFDIGVLLRSEYANAAACLGALETTRRSAASPPLPEALAAAVAGLAPDGAAAVGALVAQLLAGEGFLPEEIAVEIAPDTAVTLTLQAAANFDAAAFGRRLFGLLIEKDGAPLSVAVLAALVAVSLANGSLTISVKTADTFQDARIFAFRPREASVEAADVIEALCEKFSASDISRL